MLPIDTKHEIMAIDLNLNLTDPNWNQYTRFVSKRRQEAIGRFLHIEDKIRCLYAALLVQKKCTELAGIPLKKQFFQISEGGKPRLTDCNLLFNVSHSGDRVFACFAYDEIGVDVEELGDAPFYVMKNVFHEAEIAYVESADDAKSKNERFYEVWTCKEAFGKCKGDGIIYDLKTLNTRSEPLSDHLTTWFREGYCYSVYMDDDYHLTLIPETNESIEHFYKAQCQSQ